MNSRVISVIYFYIVSLIAIILLIVGIHTAISYTVNITQFAQYPLPYGGEDRCNAYMVPQAPSPGKTAPAISSDQAKQQCLASLALERKQQRVSDLDNAVTFTLLGLLLFASHFPIALRRSRDGK